MASVINRVFRAPYQATTRDGILSFRIAEPWYRSLPVSCITGLKVWVDDEQVPSERLSIEIGGVVRTLDECAGAWRDFWFVQDPATVRATDVSVGGQARIRAHLSMRIPYIMVGPQTALPRHIVEQQTFEVDPL